MGRYDFVRRELRNISYACATGTLINSLSSFFYGVVGRYSLAPGEYLWDVTQMYFMFIDYSDNNWVAAPHEYETVFNLIFWSLVVFFIIKAGKRLIRSEV